jgi:hypothetical protein
MSKGIKKKKRRNKTNLAFLSGNELSSSCEPANDNLKKKKKEEKDKNK